MLRRFEYKFNARSFTSLKQLNLKERQKIAKVVNQEIALFYESKLISIWSCDVLYEATLEYLDEDQDPVELQLDEQTCELIGHIVIRKYLG